MFETWHSIYEKDDAAGKSLVALLDPAAEELRGFGVQPTLVAEAPHKFNDACYDDYWCAVQFGPSYWEQSQFFEHFEHQLVKENASFVPDDVLDPAVPGTATSSRRAQALRATLRRLKEADWRAAANSTYSAQRNLLALVVELDQSWLCLEEVNGAGEGDVFSWDADGFFYVGSIERLDQAVGRPQLLIFEQLDTESLDRLGRRARSYFKPQIQSAESMQRLAPLLRQAATMVRAVTDKPVSLKASGSRSGSDLEQNPRWLRPEIYATDLRPEEREHRISKDGVWPKLHRFRTPHEEFEMSDEAKTYNAALRLLEDAKWRSELGGVLDEPLDRGETVSLFVDSQIAILTRDNSYFEVTDNGVRFLGASNYGFSMEPEHTLTNARLLGAGQ